MISLGRQGKQGRLDLRDLTDFMSANGRHWETLGDDTMSFY